jgi:hypothetical protein
VSHLLIWFFIIGSTYYIHICWSGESGLGMGGGGGGGRGLEVVVVVDERYIYIWWLVRGTTATARVLLRFTNRELLTL